jgi:two-component system, chemotaxis family, chemotaxis protein CheY
VPSGKVLVVDDDPAILTFMVRALVSEGYDVIVAPNGQHALDQLARVCPHVIVLDVMMPVMDGLAFLDARSRITNCTPPVIAISAVGENKQALRAKGVADFLPKPFNLEDLLNLIEKYTANVPE